MSQTVAPASLDQKRQAAVAAAVRAAMAGAICLVISAWMHLELAYLSIFTAYLGNLQYANTPFQKEMERIIGRITGIFFCTLLVVFFRETLILCLVLMAVALLPLWYVQGSGRFAYGTMLACIFMAQTVATGMEGPSATAVNVLGQMATQLLLGAVVLEIINFGTGAEQWAPIHPGGEPLWPLRPEWVNRSLMLTSTTLAALFAGWLTGLPAGPTVISAIILGATPSPEALEQKAIQRGAAVLIILIYSVFVLMVLTRFPNFMLLLLFLFLALFLGCYVAQMSARFSYVGLQVGIVGPMVLVVTPAEIADLDKAIGRLAGIMAGFAIAFVFQELWPMKWQTSVAAR